MNSFFFWENIPGRSFALRLPEEEKKNYFFKFSYLEKVFFGILSPISLN